MLSLFAVVALLLAAVGIYGVMHHSVIQRTHEIGIRIALGAQPRDVLGMVMRQGLGAGIGRGDTGSVGALSLTHILSSLLFGVTATDPVTFAGVSLSAAGSGHGGQLCSGPEGDEDRSDGGIALMSDE